MAWLLAWLWQGLVLTAGVALGLHLLRSASAATRYGLWWATLMAVLALPLAAPTPRVPALAGVAAGQVSTRLAQPWLPIALPEPAWWLMAIGVGAWIGALAVGLVRIGRAATRLVALKREAMPLLPDRERRLPLWLSVRGTGRPVGLAQSDAVRVPAALGLGRGVIVVPRTLVNRLDDEDLDQVVLHEYGHLRRRDDWGRLVQAVVQAMIWFHPAVWWIGRQLELEREAACDDFVVRRSGAVQRYAACLVRAAELSSAPARAGMLAPGMGSSGRVLLARVVRLLDGRTRRRRLGLAAGVLAGGMAMLAAGVGTLARSRPLVAVASPLTLGMPAVAGPGWTQPLMPARVAPIGVPLMPPVAPPARRTTRPAARPLGSVVTRGVLDVSGVPTSSTAWQPPARLKSAPLAITPEAGLVPAGGASLARPVPIAESAADGPWRAVAEAGSAIGSGFKEAGVSTAGWFARVGRSVAGAM